MQTKVFISWSGPLSMELGQAIRDWLPMVLQFVKPYFTPSDIEKGARWSSSIAAELGTTNVGIICLTKDNITAPWIIFEAGALSKSVDNANVCPILFDFEPANLSSPLNIFQATKFEKADIFKLVSAINNTGGDMKLDQAALTQTFETWWLQLESKVQDILSRSQPQTVAPQRSNEDMLKELLELTRLIAKDIPATPEFSTDVPTVTIKRKNKSFFADLLVTRSDDKPIEAIQVNDLLRKCKVILVKGDWARRFTDEHTLHCTILYDHIDKLINVYEIFRTNGYNVNLMNGDEDSI